MNSNSDNEALQKENKRRKKAVKEKKYSAFSINFRNARNKILK